MLDRRRRATKCDEGVVLNETLSVIWRRSRAMVLSSQHRA